MPGLTSLKVARLFSRLGNAEMAVDIAEILRRELTDEQRLAAIDPATEVLTLACAGSGKSTTLGFRIAWLVAPPLNTDPHSIVAFTFTEKAAEAIKLRVSGALLKAGLDPTAVGAMFIGTIHSYCQQVLTAMDARYRQFDVLDENRLTLYLMSRYPQLGLHRLRNARAARYFETIKEVANAWKTLNDELLPVDAVNHHDPDLADVLQRVDDQLAENQYIDFSLMIRRVVDALRDHDPGAERAVAKLRHLMCDEYQDVNPAQEALIRELHDRSETLFVVGDDDQAIYGWRGADVSNIITFRQRYPTASEHTLAINYRSTAAIVRTSDAFAAAELGATRLVKNPVAAADATPRHYGVHWFDVRAEEATWVAERIRLLLGTAYVERSGLRRGLTPADFAVLMRSTRQPEANDSPRHAAFTTALRGLGIAYTLEAGGSVFDRTQVDVLRGAFLLLRDGSPSRTQADAYFKSRVAPAYPNAQFEQFATVLAQWGRLIHTPIGGARRRVYPQQLVHELLEAFGIKETAFDAGTMADIGVFSRMMQDVETVYLSIDSAGRFTEICNFLQNVAESGYDSGTDELLRRPDTVTVATVHKVKGLEFPVVFVVDLEAGRFPKSRSGYEGWLPLPVIQDALARGAYQSTAAEEARLFYTAVTRAERFLYATGARALPGGVRPRKPSVYSQRLRDAEITAERANQPAGLEAAAPVRRIDETVLPTSYSEIRYYLRCPADFRYRTMFGFSPPITEMFGYGMTVHAAVGKLHERYPDRAPTTDEAAATARNTFHLKHVPPSNDPVNNPGPYERAKDSAVRVLQEYSGTYAPDFEHRRQLEVPFEVPVASAVISGSIDLLLHEDDEGNPLDASVIDFKAMRGGDIPESNEDLYWTELSLQVQLYARASRLVLGANTRTGAVHLLKDNQRVAVPVGDGAIESAVANVEWAVERIISGDFPMRPSLTKCASCDFALLCPKRPQNFATAAQPPAIATPGGFEMARVFSDYKED